MKLKMMTDQVEQMANQMTKTVTDITTAMRDVKSACDALVNVTWKSSAANEFQQLLTQLQTTSQPKIQDLDKLKGRLTKEKEQWIQTGAKLAG